MKNKISVVVLVAIMFIVFTITAIPSGLAAQENDTPPDFSELIQEKETMSDSEKKLSTSILQLTSSKYLPTDMTTNDVIAEMKQLEQIAEVPITYGEDDDSSGFEVYVYIRLDKGVDSDILLPHVSRIVNEDMDYGLVTAWVDLNSLMGLASLDEVRSIREVIPPITHSGSVTSQGDYVHSTDLVRGLLGADGSGIKVGIISDGVDNYLSAVATGDLPGDVTVLSNLRGGDEGTAMLEIVHDLAPGADLYFHDSGSSVLEFNDAITSLANAGCDVICDDIGWLLEPYFEDGVIAQHIDNLLDTTDIIYTSSAGNSANEHYQGLYHNLGDSSADFSGGANPSKPYLYATVPAGGSIQVVMQWDDPFGASSNDYDLYLFDSDTDTVITSSVYTQDGNDDPLERVYVQNNSGGEKHFEIIAVAYNAPVDKTLELFVYPGGGTTVDSTNIVKADSIFGHPAVSEVLSCAAVPQYAPDTIEDFSCLGPVTLISETRQKPDISGTDGVHVTGAGGFGQYISGNYYFFGTSASAPHIAAIAAVLQSRFPSKPPSEIRQLILDSAVDLGDSGYDNVYGYGRGDAMDAALKYVYVKFDSDGGSVVDTQLIPNGGKPTEPDDPTKTGCSFDGWYKEETYDNEWVFGSDTATTDTTLFAKWIEDASINTITEDGTYDISTYGDNSIVLIDSGLTVTLTNDSRTAYTNMQIVCDGGVSLTIDEVTIYNQNIDDVCPISFTESGNQLIVTGYSNLRGGKNEPGIRVEEGTTLIISGDGNVSAYSGSDAAAIGGGNESNCGTIEIISGDIDGYALDFGAAGIGGGANGSGGTITISGGVVSGRSCYDAGIGGGANGSGGDVTITGGTVYAYSYSSPCNIGYGSGGSGGTLAISGDAEVLLSDGTSVTPVTTHELVSTSIETNDIVFGKIELPGGWEPPVYAYLDTDELYNLTYDGNGGMNTQIAPYFRDTTAVLLSNISNGDSVLTGWNTKADGTGIAYVPGDKISMTSDLTLYAMWAEMFDGSGTEADPYLIETAKDLCVAAQLINADETAYSDDKHYKQTKDIDLAIYDKWVPIGWNETFVGTYNGDGYTISNINIEMSDIGYEHVGLFGRVEGTLENINIVGGSINVTGTTSMAVGSIVGYLENSVLQNCSSSANVSASSSDGSSSIGGILGRAEQVVTISDCDYSGKLTCGGHNPRVGGIVGYMYHSTHVINCENTGDIQAQGEYVIVGGIAGYTYLSSLDMHSISSSRNTGDINVLNNTSSMHTGGIIGKAQHVDITNCKNLGNIFVDAPGGSAYEGGIVGYSSESVSITDCANRAGIVVENSVSVVYSGGIVGGVWSGDAQFAISQSYNTGDISIISPENWVCTGGIVGDNSSGSISECYNTGNLTVESPENSSYIGGILGKKTGSTYTLSITDCFNGGTLVGQGTTRGGGIFGYGVSNNTTISNCYNVGAINVETYYGGIAADIGVTYEGVFSNCYFADTCDNGIGSGTDTVTSKTLTELKQQATFSGFDFTDTWEIIEGLRYPVLQKTSFEYVTGVSIDEILGLDVGTSKTLIPIFIPSDASNHHVTWSSSNEAVATVSADGNVTLLTDDTATITVTTFDGGFTDSCEVFKRVPVTGVTPSESSLTLTHHDTQTLTATVLPNDATYPQVSWTSIDEQVATVDENGVVTAVGVGSTSINATADGVSGTCIVTVERKPVTSITFSSYDDLMISGDTQTLLVTVLPDDASYPQVTWTSNDEDIATVDESGVVIAGQEGSVEIVATADGISESVVIVVKNPDLNGDDTIDLLDTVVAAQTYGTKTGQPGFNPAVDMNGDGIINLFDMIVIAVRV